MREALLIIFALGSLEVVLWVLSSIEVRKQTRLLEMIADNLTIVEMNEEEDDEADVTESTAVC